MALAIVALTLSIIVLFLFGSIALYYATKVKEESNDDTEFFLTARNSQTAAKIAWSFYSSTVGAWCLFVPSAYTVNPIGGAGWLGLVIYCVCTGLPILIIAWLGSLIRVRYPNALSIGDFAHKRFGRTMEIYTTILVVFSVGLALSIEYTTIGGLFSHFYGIHPTIPIALVFTVTMIYTSIGGIYVSIVTDQWQAQFSILLSAIALLYIAATFRPNSLPELPDYLAVNEAGIGSLITLGISFPAVSMFNDAYWQRVWSSEDELALKRGSFAAFIMVTAVTFIFGFGGFLASWAGYVTDPSFAFFEIITSPGGVYSDIILVLVTLLATAMNESLVDSYQNALTDCVSSLGLSCGLNISISSARIITIIVNMPIVIIGLQGYDVNSLFLVSCLAATTSCSPIIMGIFPFFDNYIHESTAVFSCVFSVFSICIYGWIQTRSFAAGVYYCFWETYRWQVFLVAIASSLIGISLFILFEAMCESIFKESLTSRVSLDAAQVPKHAEKFIISHSLMED